MKTAVAIWIGSCAIAAAQLQWEHRVLEVRPDILATNATARFVFRNAGNTTVKISAISTSCGCTTANLEERTYAPGAKGEVMAIFRIGERIGQQEARISVESNASGEPMSVLTMRVFIPDVIHFGSPRYASWKIGDDPLAQSIHVDVHPSVKILKVGSNNDFFSVRLKPVQPPREYVLSVTPKGTGQSTRAVLRIETSAPEGRPKIYYTFAEVR